MHAVVFVVVEFYLGVRESLFETFSDDLSCFHNACYKAVFSQSG